MSRDPVAMATYGLVFSAVSGTPSLTSATAGDTQVVVALTAGDATDRVYIRYRLTTGTTWSAESVTFSRIGSGNVTITGLTNGRR